MNLEEVQVHSYVHLEWLLYALLHVVVDDSFETYLKWYNFRVSSLEEIKEIIHFNFHNQACVKLARPKNNGRSFEKH